MIMGRTESTFDDFNCTTAVIAVVSNNQELIAALRHTLVNIEIVPVSYAELMAFKWHGFAALLVDFDEVDITTHIQRHRQMTDQGFAGAVIGLASVVDASLDRQLRLLHQHGLHLHSNEIDLLILGITLDSVIRDCSKSGPFGRRSAKGMAGTAREIATLIKVWNKRLENEQGNQGAGE
tara:strand:+ start:1273 stop:1809 length:537 start_codon:yes stop_codon:yes gene_type:complete